MSKYVSSCPFPQNSNRSYHFTLHSVLLLGEWLSHLEKFRNGGKSYNSITSSRNFEGRKKSYFRHEDGMESLEWWRFFMWRFSVELIFLTHEMNCRPSYFIDKNRQEAQSRQELCVESSSQGRFRWACCCSNDTRTNTWIIYYEINLQTLIIVLNRNFNFLNLIIVFNRSSLFVPDGLLGPPARSG